MVALLSGLIVAVTLALPPPSKAEFPVPTAPARGTPSSHRLVHDTLANLSIAQSERIRQIVQMAANSDSGLTTPVRREFWGLVNQIKPSQRALEMVRDR